MLSLWFFLCRLLLVPVRILVYSTFICSFLFDLFVLGDDTLSIEHFPLASFVGVLTISSTLAVRVEEEGGVVVLLLLRSKHDDL